MFVRWQYEITEETDQYEDYPDLICVILNIYYDKFRKDKRYSELIYPFSESKIIIDFGFMIQKDGEKVRRIRKLDTHVRQRSANS